MSASLVGSEMCIRDSTTARYRVLPRTTAYYRVLQRTTAFYHVLPCTTAPVSYTHLTLPTICSV
eukprot:3548337-Alexandrium_andersonii.AAC.1